MAVYTVVEQGDLETFLRGYGLGAYRGHEGILQGVSNSNYHLFTDQGRFVLTLFEEKWGVMDNLPFYFSFTGHLAQSGIPCPRALPDLQGKIIGTLCGKKAVLVSYLEGRTVGAGDIEPGHCRAMGAMLARMHLAAQDFSLVQENNEDIQCWKKLAGETAADADRVEKGLAGCIADELAFLEKHWPDDVPQAVVHTDIFPDNILFYEEHISAVLDFYFSCRAMLAYDLAIVINAWCFDGDGIFCRDRFSVLLNAYEALRPLQESERRAMPVLLRGACIRFLMTRLHDWIFHDPESLVSLHDPREYLEKLRFHRKENIFDC